MLAKVIYSIWSQDGKYWLEGENSGPSGGYILFTCTSSLKFILIICKFPVHTFYKILINWLSKTILLKS